MENLRYFLYPFSSAYPISFGYRLSFVGSNRVLNDYYSGGAGYILSKAAIKKVVEDGILSETSPCLRGDIGNEDVNVGNCLGRVGVVHGNDADDDGKPRLLIFSAGIMLNMDRVSPRDGWIWKYVYHKPKFVSILLIGSGTHRYFPSVFVFLIF